jgi:hypothetical protein
MAEMRRFGLVDLVLLLVVVGVGAGARAWYLVACADSGNNAGPLRVEKAPAPIAGLPPGTKLRGRENPNELDALIHHLAEKQWFGGPAPFAQGEELTAHTAPGYAWVASWIARWVGVERLDYSLRWAQCALGALTAGLYFLFSRRAFRHLGVATLAGLFCALHPFWVIDTTAISDSVLSSFVVALALWLGARAGQEGGPFASLVYGLSLAGAALVRAALTPFAFVALAWFLLRSRALAGGWLYALLAFLGFAIGLTPWTVRNFQVFGEPVPVVDSAHLHLWIGNNPAATGGPLTDTIQAMAPSDELAKITRQPERYSRLGSLAWQEIREHPVATIQRRLHAALAFFLGECWLRDGTLAETTGEGELPPRLEAAYPMALHASLAGMLALAMLGWRWTYGWRWEAMPSSLALLWIPLPYILSHAEELSGPRLPLDGVLLSYAAFALVCFIPGVGGVLFEGGDGPRREERP